MKRRLIPVLAPEAVASLPTKQLLGRLRSLQQCEQSAAVSDRTPEELAVREGILFKDTAEWKRAYADLKAVLAVRGQVPSAAERATARQQRTEKRSNKRDGGRGGTARLRRAAGQWSAAPHHGRSCMTQQDLIAAFVSPSAEDIAAGHDAIVAKLRDRLRQLTSEQQFQILFPIAVRSQRVGEFPVLEAALLLEELSPECPISCEDAVRALLPEWDISIEQVPFYLAARFGSARVQQAIASLEPEVRDKHQKVNLDTVSYWAHIYEGTWPPKQNRISPAL